VGPVAAWLDIQVRVQPAPSARWDHSNPSQDHRHAPCALGIHHPQGWAARTLLRASAMPDSPGQTEVISVCRVIEAATRTFWVILHAAHALQTLAQRLAVPSWWIAVVVVGFRGQMELCACRAAQAAIRMQRAIHLAWLVQLAPTRRGLHLLSAPAVLCKQFLHSDLSFWQTAYATKGTADLTEVCAEHAQEGSSKAFSATPLALNAPTAPPRRKALITSQIASALLDTRAPPDKSALLASLESISLILDMQCAQTALLALLRITLDQGRAPSAHQVQDRQQAVTCRQHARVNQDLQEWLEDHRALPVMLANFKMKVGCVCRASPLLVELDNTGKVVWKSPDPWMPFATIARQWRTQSLHLMAEIQTTARGSARMDLKKIAGPMRVKDVVLTNSTKEHVKRVNPLGFRSVKLAPQEQNATDQR